MGAGGPSIDEEQKGCSTLLRHPDDIVAWQRWHDLQHPVRHGFRTARSRLRGYSEARMDLLIPGEAVGALVAVEAVHSSFHHAVVAPLDWMPEAQTALAVPVGCQVPWAFARHDRWTIASTELAEHLQPKVVLAAGHFTPIGAAVHALAARHDIPFLVSQHGALTPFAPPLPPGAHLLAWSEEDGIFWASGRPDVVVTTTGSQLLWHAASAAEATSPEADKEASARLTYLGQGHAAEISRARLVHAAFTTCRQHGAVYRPHPSEHDVTSRAVLRAYARCGIDVDTSGPPLVALEAPIVSVFSTGVLEAAARGRRAWVDFPRPPTWLGEFWERYGMQRLGTDPTPAPPRPLVEPARRIADIVSEVCR